MGLIENAGSVTLLGWLTNPASFNISTIFQSMSEVLTLGTAGASLVIAGALTFSGKADLAIFVVLAELFFLVGWDIYAIYQGLSAISPVLATIIVAPTMLIYSITVFEWWRAQS